MRDRLTRLSLVLPLLVLLAGCSTAPLPGTVKPGETPTPTPTATAIIEFVPVDPVEYGTLLADAGVDFDSPDGGIHCGILGFGDGRQFFGCAVDDAAYDEPPGTAAGCGGGFVTAVTGAPEVLCETTFAGETPERYPDVRVLPVGASVTTLGVTCFSGDDGIACVSDTTGAGFRVSADSYELF